MTARPNNECHASVGKGEVLVRVEAVSKKFCRSLRKSLWYGLRDIAWELNPISNCWGNGPDSTPRREHCSQLRDEEFWAVDRVSFALRRGECLGLIGRNGAGKTTLLKMLTGLIKPDLGRIEVSGRLGALIALGTGFNPILTGRENIYINASILGLSNSEIEARIDGIIDFAELEDFIDTPVQSYSSGMQVRLGFAVATALKPDILFVDEVLAVGDAAFRAKCRTRLSEMKENGTAFILVSHSRHMLHSICDRGLLLSRGKLMADGAIGEALDRYDTLVMEEILSSSIKPSLVSVTRGLPCRIIEVYFRDLQGNRIDAPQTGHVVDLCVLTDSPEQFCEVSLDIIISDACTAGDAVLSIASGQDDRRQSLPVGRSEYHLRFDPLGLTPGPYLLKLSLNQRPFRALAVVEQVAFEVEPGMVCGDSMFYNRRQWKIMSAVDP